MIKYHCDVCNEEMTEERYCGPQPSDSVRVFGAGVTLCEKCIKAFDSLDIADIVHKEIIRARPDIPSLA